MKSSFTLAKGSVVSSLILLILTPLITRMYTPEDFGYYGLLLSLSSIVSVGLFLRLEFSLKNRKDYELKKFIPAVFFIVTFATSIIAVVIIYYVLKFGDFELNDDNGFITSSLLVVFLAWLYSFHYVLTIFSSRLEFYKEINQSKILRNLSLGSAQISLGYLHPSFISLIISECFARFIALYIVFKKINISFVFSKKYIRRFINGGKEYILFSTPASYINAVTINILPIFTSSFYGATKAGVVFLITKLVAVPISLLGQSLSVSYVGKISTKLEEKDYLDIHRAIKKMIVYLSLSSTLIFLIFSLFLKYYSSLIFGDEWGDIANIFIYLIPAYISQVTFSSFSQSLNVFGMQKIQLLWDFVRLPIIVFSLYIPFYLYGDDGFNISLLIYSISMSIMYIVQYYLLYRFLKRNSKSECYKVA